MSGQANNFSRREMLRRRVLALVAAIVMGASLVFTLSASAHNIDVAKARELAREYARQMRDGSGGKYTNYTTRCGAMFPNHNHLVSCTIQYYNAKDKAAGVYTCKEKIQLHMGSHSRSNEDYRILGNHISSQCGSRTLNNTLML
jgi:hypothetical protein